jgi:hypothetical protein
MVIRFTVAAGFVLAFLALDELPETPHPLGL